LKFRCFGPQPAVFRPDMGAVRPKTLLYACWRNRVFAAIATTLLLFQTLRPASAQPTLSPPVLSNDLVHAQMTLSNCTNTTLQYFLQTSTDLVNWSNVQATFAVFTNLVVTIPATNQAGFYQIVTNVAPIFQTAVMVVSNFDWHGYTSLVDSFDSSNPFYNNGSGQYVSTKRNASGGVYTGNSIVNTNPSGNLNIWGRVMTGPGTTQSNVNLGVAGAVGNAAWNVGHTGIESNYWSGGFVPTLPDVVPPIGGSNLPAAVSNVITLNGNYVAASDPGANLKIVGATSLWIQGSYSGNITITTPNSSLTLYVGTTTGSGDSLNWTNQSTVNSPGYANNLQVFGLPSLNSISFTGNSTFVGTVYAPEADVIGGGGGANTLNTMGSMVCRSITLSGKWNIHYDQSLTNNGPAFWSGGPPLGN
jgi:hypothetical protein